MYFITVTIVIIVIILLWRNLSTRIHVSEAICTIFAHSRAHKHSPNYTRASRKFDKPTLRGVYMRMAGWECEAHTLSNTSGNLKKAYPYTQFICRNKLMWLTSLVLFCFCQACKKCPRYKPLCSLYLFQKNILFCVSHS